MQNKPVHVHCPGLADTMSSVHRLQIFHWVPVMFCEDHDVCPSQSQSPAAYWCCQNQHPITRVRVESVHRLDSFVARLRPFQLQKFDAKLWQNLVNNQLHKAAHLTKYQRSMRLDLFCRLVWIAKHICKSAQDVIWYVFFFSLIVHGSRW